MVKFSTHLMQQNRERKIRVKKNDGIQLIPCNDVLYIEAETPYTYLHLSTGQNIFCCEPIRRFDEKLSPHGFIRIHKSIIVNVTGIEAYFKDGNGSLLLIDGTRLKLARGKKQLLLEYLAEYFL